MYASNSNLYREPIPISSQFAEVLESDIQDYVENLRQLDTPEIAFDYKVLVIECYLKILFSNHRLFKV
jgi:hypothetical protein